MKKTRIIFDPQTGYYKLTGNPRGSDMSEWESVDESFWVTKNKAEAERMANRLKIMIREGRTVT